MAWEARVNGVLDKVAAQVSPTNSSLKDVKLMAGGLR